MLEKEPVKSQSEDLKRSIGISVALHSLVVSLFLIRSLFFSEPHIDLSQAITVSVGEMPDAKRLPEKIQPVAPPQPEPAPEPEPEPPAPPPEVAEKTPPPPEPKNLPPKDPPKNEVNLDKSKNRQREALNKLKKMSALEKIRQDVKNENVARNKASNSAPTRPRVIAAGTTLSGLDRLQANDYLGLVDQGIKQYWALPQWMMNKPFKAQVLVKFTANGQIVSKEVITSSGNSTYDQYCLDAIEKAAPFPPVPEKLSEKFRVDGIVIGFPE